MLHSWRILPDWRLSHREPDSAALVEAGCRTYRDAARYLHELPYGRNPDRADYKLVLTELRGTCSTKHALLAAVAAEQGIPVSLTVGIYEMNEANTPGVGSVLAAHRLRAVPEAHCYLTYRHDRVDVTRSGVTPTMVITHFEHEQSIDPSQIGEYKIRLHRTFLEAWLRQRPSLQLSLDELWRIREDCIAALRESQEARGAAQFAAPR